MEFNLSVLPSLTFKGEALGNRNELPSVDLTLSRLDLRIIIICKTTTGSNKTKSKAKSKSLRENINTPPRPTTKLAIKVP